MTNEEFKNKRDSRTEDLISQIQRHDDTIANIVKSAYERGYADGMKKDVTMLSNNLTFGDLRPCFLYNDDRIIFEDTSCYQMMEECKVIDIDPHWDKFEVLGLTPTRDDTIVIKLNYWIGRYEDRVEVEK